MTLASAIALRSTAGMDLLLTLSDSRLTLTSTNVGHTDAAIKSFGLGPQSVVTMAGSTLPVATAVEGARGLIANANALRAAAGGPRLSLLEEARQFATFFSLCCHELVGFRTDILLSGFFADSVPGIVKICFAGGSFATFVFRPRRGDFAVATIGDRYFAGIATQAIGETLARGTTGHDLFEQAASVFWDVIQHAGAPGIGGGLALGMCRKEQSCWQWPMVIIDSRPYYRGLAVAEVPTEWEPSAISVRHDPTTFGRVEAKQPVDGFASEYPTPAAIGHGFAPDPSDWVLTEEEAAILGVDIQS